MSFLDHKWPKKKGLKALFEIFQQNDTIMIAHNNTNMPSNAKMTFREGEKYGRYRVKQDRKE